MRPSTPTAENHEADEDVAAVAHEELVDMLELGRQEGGQNFAPVQGMERQQVEGHEDEVEAQERVEQLFDLRVEHARRRGAKGHPEHEPGQNQVPDRSRDRHDREARAHRDLARVVARLGRHRLAPAEQDIGAPKPEHQRQQQGPDGIRVHDRVEREAPLRLGGRVPETIGEEGMEVLMDRDGEHQANQVDPCPLDVFAGYGQKHHAVPAGPNSCVSRAKPC